MEKQKQSQRLLSLDALRGFDMFFIMGGASLFVALATLFPNSFFQAIGGQMDHVEWDGLTHHDTIFPLFLFIAGISFPFSLEKQREQGKSESDIYKRMVGRGIRWGLLGFLYTSEAAEEKRGVDPGGGHVIKKKNYKLRVVTATGRHSITIATVLTTDTTLMYMHY